MKAGHDLDFDFDVVCDDELLLTEPSDRRSSTGSRGGGHRRASSGSERLSISPLRMAGATARRRSSEGACVDPWFRKHHPLHEQGAAGSPTAHGQQATRDAAQAKRRSTGTARSVRREGSAVGTGRGKENGNSGVAAKRRAGPQAGKKYGRGVTKESLAEALQKVRERCCCCRRRSRCYCYRVVIVRMGVL